MRLLAVREGILVLRTAVSSDCFHEVATLPLPHFPQFYSLAVVSIDDTVLDRCGRQQLEYSSHVPS